MRSLFTRFTAFYGSNPLHLLGTVAALALAGYVVTVLGPHALWNHTVWWQSIVVWFSAAVIAHDLVLFPLYALADRSVTTALAAVRGRRPRASPRLSPLNYLRVPSLATGLSLLLFFPGSSAGTSQLCRGDRTKPTTISGAGCCLSAPCTVSAQPTQRGSLLTGAAGKAPTSHRCRP